MAGYIIWGTLAAFGLLGILWCLFGAMLPGTRGWVLVIWEEPEQEQLWRLLWLRSLGLLNCPMVAVAARESAEGDSKIEICTGEALLSRLEEERNRGNGTGNGDHPGCHQRRGISEL